MQDHRLALSVTESSGRIKRWGPGEGSVGDIPEGLSFTTADPNCFDTAQLQLRRPVDRSWPDFQLLADVAIYGLGGRTAWEGRLQETPNHAGAEEVWSPGAVGHAAHLNDDTSFAEIYIDRDLGKWGDSSVARQLALNNATYGPTPDRKISYAETGSNGPGIIHTFNGVNSGNPTPYPIAENWYFGGGVDIGRVFFDQRSDGTPSWEKFLVMCGTDVSSGPTAISPNYSAFIENLQQGVEGGVAGLKYAYFITAYKAGTNFTMTNTQRWLNIAVLGRHTVPLRGTWPAIGYYASDMIADVVRRAAPRLNFTTGEGGSITPSSLVIPHMTFNTGIKAADAILAMNAYHQYSWGVEDGKTFFWRPTTTFRKRWRVRRSLGHEIDLLGPQAENAINGVMVSFTDPGGTSRVVAPPGAATAIATSTALQDTSTTNPVNAAGIPRKWGELQLGFVTDIPGAIAVGAAWFAEQLANNNSRGSVVVPGLVEDENGALFPSWAMRAGDSVTPTDGDGLERRILDTNYEHDTRTLTANLDSTPHKVEALMERMGLALVGVTE